MKIKSKSSKVNKAWLNDHMNDPYVKLAQREGYRARAAYKLKEIDEIAELMQDPDENFQALKNVFESNKKFRLLTGALL